MVDDPKHEHEPVITPEDAMHDTTNDVPPKLGDLVRRAVMAGVGAVFLTEEGIRKTVSELKLPKEAFGYLSSQADRTRKEASRIVRKEVRRFLNSEAFKQQVHDFLSGMTLEIKAEVRLKPSPEGMRPEVKADLDVKSEPKSDPFHEPARAAPPVAEARAVIFGLAAAYVLQHFYGTHPVELLVAIPSEKDSGAGVDVRITREHDPKLVLEVSEPTRASKSHTVVIHTKLAYGRYEARAWLDDAAHTAFTATFAFEGGETVEVPLVSR